MCLVWHDIVRRVDIHNLLNSGEVPNLFAPDEKSALQEQVSRAARSAKKSVDTVEQAYAFFIERVRENLHVVLALSPASATFRDWLRQYPSLVRVHARVRIANERVVLDCIAGSEHHVALSCAVAGQLLHDRLVHRMAA